ncbi:MAG TPA: acetylglutamate kinase [Longimicrobiales bacterium]|nr:acetylglutamate kinase [Longimicrobiales bacterium]
MTPTDVFGFGGAGAGRDDALAGQDVASDAPGRGSAARGSIAVLKVGGRLVETEAGAHALAAAVAKLVPRDAGPVAAGEGAPAVVIVHGGGAQVSALGRRLGDEPTFRDGQRVTDEATLRLVSMVLSGEVNKRIVRALVGAGVRAAGLSGEDGPTIRAAIAEGGALGRVGRVEAVDPTLLAAMLAADFVPVVAPVSLGPDGGALNVNADVAAVAVAAALGAAKLYFLSDVPAVRDGAGVEIVALDPSEGERLVAAGVAAGGMIPKLAAAREAVAAGIGEVRIGALDALFGGGTRIRGAPAPAPPAAPAGAPA